MPINLNRAEMIGSEESNTTPKSNLLFGNIEVLSLHKRPFAGVSFLREDGYYQCPFCRKSSIKQILDYRCVACQSKVIYWKCYVTKKEEKHVLYDNYIARFHEASHYMVEKLKEKYKKEGKEWRGTVHG